MMASRFGILFLLVSFVSADLLVPRCSTSSCTQNTQVYIYAGNNLITGKVTLSSTPTNVVITITQLNGWQLTTADLYIGTSASPCSLSSFNYRTGTLDSLPSYTWTIPFNHFSCGQIVNVAVHTVSKNPGLKQSGCGSSSTPSESGWAAGHAFSSGYGYYFQWHICCVSATTGVPTTRVPTTRVPTTQVPTTRVPTTAVPTTAVPTTKVPTTQVPTTQVPTTKVPTTQVPTTRVATTQVPTTRVATTHVPTTRSATTRASATTKSVTTRVATTAVPTTKVPTTQVPTTQVPTTKVPTTQVPTTAVPTTAVPTTAVPTTAVPTTAVPTTDVPTTDVPTTAVPTTADVTTGIVVPPPPPPYPYGTCDDKDHFFGYLTSFFNTFVHDNFTCYYSDTEGRLAAGGNIDLFNYAVGCKLFATDSCSYTVTCDDIADQGEIIDSVVAGMDVHIIQGSVYVGNIASGGTYNNDITVNWGPGCTLFEGQVIDFDSAFDFLKNLAATVAQQNSTGTVVNNYNSFTFQGTNNPDIEVFDIDGSVLCGSYGVTLDLSTVASTASIFVNVAGTGYTCSNFQLTNFQSNQTLWNFYEATEMSFQNIGWKGSVLAPWADLNGAKNGAIDGQVFVNSWYSPDSCMQQNWIPFVGCLPSAGHIQSDDF